MNLLLAGLAAFSVPSDPGFVVQAVTDHCEPYVRGERTLEQARDAVVAAGFAVERDEEYADPARELEEGQEPPPDFPARAIRLRRPDGAALILAVEREGPRCLAEAPTADPDALTGLIEETGRWLRFPPRFENGMPPTEARWLSSDGRLTLSSDVAFVDRHPRVPAYAHVEPAGQPPEIMLARLRRMTAAGRRTPGEALIWGVRAWCPGTHGSSPEAGTPDARDDLADGVAGNGTMNGGHLRIDFRHRDPQTLVAWVYGPGCLLLVHGPGREQAVSDLRASLDADGGWTRAGEPDVWTRDGSTLTLSPVEFIEGPATRVRIRSGERGQDDAPW